MAMQASRPRCMAKLRAQARTTSSRKPLENRSRFTSLRSQLLDLKTDLKEERPRKKRDDTSGTTRRKRWVQLLA